MSLLAADIAEPLAREIEKVRTAGGIGRSSALNSLFDFLAECSLAGRSPKESEVAMEVFGRRPDFDPGQDAVARVYVHKLRRKLEQTPGEAGQPRLAIPRGEYRLVLNGVTEVEADPVAAVDRVDPKRRRLLFGLAGHGATAAVAAGAGWFAAASGSASAPTALAAARRSAVWAPLLANGLPTVVAVGDYYLFGDTGEGDQSERLVREYAVNSRADLDEYLMMHPDKIGRYVDLDLRYLPVGAGFGLAEVMPILAAKRAPSATTRVILASEVTPAMIKTVNIVYVGFLSGMGLLRDAVWADSRFRIGESYDELIDSRTQQRFFSQGGGEMAPGAVYRDYGYFSTFGGPEGGRIVVIAGTRDAAVRQVAEAAGAPRSLKAMQDAAKGAKGFEALYVVDGMNHLNVSGRLLSGSPLDDKAIWSRAGKTARRYPEG